MIYLLPLQTFWNKNFTRNVEPQTVEKSRQQRSTVVSRGEYCDKRVFHCCWLDLYITNSLDNYIWRKPFLIVCSSTFFQMVPKLLI